MQIRWKTIYFSCPTSLINTVLLSLICIVKSITSFILQMSYFYQYLGCFQLGANRRETTMNILCNSMVCIVVGDWLFLNLKCIIVACVCIWWVCMGSCFCVEIREQLQVCSLRLLSHGLWGSTSDRPQIARLAWEEPLWPCLGFLYRHSMPVLSNSCTHSVPSFLLVSWSKTLRADGLVHRCRRMHTKACS